MKRSKELKTMARMQLAGKYSTYIGAYALFFMISGTVASLLGFFLMSGSLSSSDGLPFTSIPQLILYFVIELIVSLILSIFSLGFNKMFLDGSRGYRVRFEDLFYGFRHHPDRVILLQFLLLLISMACMAPGYILVLCDEHGAPHPCTDSQYHPSDRRNHSVGLLCFNFQPEYLPDRRL